MDSGSIRDGRARNVRDTCATEIAQPIEEFEKLSVAESVGNIEITATVDSSVPFDKSYDVGNIFPKIGISANENLLADNLLTRSQFIDNVTNGLLRDITSGKNAPKLMNVTERRDKHSIPDERSVFIDSHLFWKPQESTNDNVAVCPKERKRWRRPVSNATDYVQQESIENSSLNDKRLVTDSYPGENKHRLSVGINENDGVCKIRTIEISDSCLAPPRSLENEGKNVSPSDNVPPAPSPSSVSSVTSSRRLEWDSGADVGYATQGFLAEHRVELSTIERIALARGCTAVLCSRMDPDRTPASGNPCGSEQKPSAKGVKPVAHSTPIEQGNAQIEERGSATETEHEIEITPILRPSTVSGDTVTIHEQIQKSIAEFLQRSKDLCCPNDVPGDMPLSEVNFPISSGAKHSNSLTDLQKCEGKKSLENSTNSLPRNHSKGVHLSKDRQLTDIKNNHYSASSSSVATVVYQQKLAPSNPVAVTASKPTSSSADCGTKCSCTCETFNLEEELKKCLLKVYEQGGEETRKEPVEALKNIRKPSVVDNEGEVLEKVGHERQHSPQSCAPDGGNVEDGHTADVGKVVGRSSAAEGQGTPTGSMGSSVRTAGPPWQESAALVGSANSFEYLPGHAYNKRDSGSGRSVSPARATDGKLWDSSVSDGDVERSVWLLQGATAGMRSEGQRQLLVDCVAKQLLGLPELPSPSEASERPQHDTTGLQESQAREVESSDVSSTLFKPQHGARGRTVSTDKGMRHVSSSCAANGSLPSDSTVETTSSFSMCHEAMRRDWMASATLSERAFEQRRSHIKYVDNKAMSRNHFALLEFCDSQRASQLSWIQMEIDHLKNLKHLLTGQKALHHPGKVAAVADGYQKPSAPVCTLMKITRNTLQASRSETSTTERERSISVTHDERGIHEVECRSGVRQIVSRRPAVLATHGSPVEGEQCGKNFLVGRDVRTQTCREEMAGSGCDASVQADFTRRKETPISSERSASAKDECAMRSFPVQSSATCVRGGQFATFDYPKYHVTHDSGSEQERNYGRLCDVGMQIEGIENITEKSDNAPRCMSSWRDEGKLHDACTQVSSTQSVSGRREYITSQKNDRRSNNVCTQTPDIENGTGRTDNKHSYRTSKKDDERFRDAPTRLPSTQDITENCDNTRGYITSQKDDAKSLNTYNQVQSTQNITGKSGRGYITCERIVGSLHDVCTQVPSTENVIGKSDSRYNITSQGDDARLHNVYTQVPSARTITERTSSRPGYVSSQRDDVRWRNVCTQVPSAQDVTRISRKSSSQLHSKQLHTKRSKLISTQTDILGDSNSTIPPSNGTLEGISERILDSNHVSNANIPSGGHNVNLPEVEFLQDPGSAQNKTDSPMCCCECRRELKKLLSENERVLKKDSVKQRKVTPDNIMPMCRVCGMRLNECAEKRTEGFFRKTVDKTVTRTSSFEALPLIQPQWVGQDESDVKLGKRCPCCFSVEDDSTDASSGVEKITGVEASVGRPLCHWKPGRTTASCTRPRDGTASSARVRRVEERDAQHQVGPRAAETRSPDGFLPSPVGYILTLESSPSIDSGVQLEERRRRKSLAEVKVKVPSRKRAARERIRSCLAAGEKHPKGKCDGRTRAKENVYQKKPTLQEWLLKNRPDFVATAEERRQCLQELAEMREARCRSIQHGPASGASNEKAGSSADVPPPPLAVKRIFDQRTMRRQTEKKYQRLPEVQNKKTERKRKEDYRTNRLMAEIFTRKLQKKVLKGEVNLSNSFMSATSKRRYNMAEPPSRASWDICSRCERALKCFLGNPFS